MEVKCEGRRGCGSVQLAFGDLDYGVLEFLQLLGDDEPASGEGLVLWRGLGVV